jgi:16S rRNA (cytidine1402-2'-O)-methyltransferase
LLAALELPKKTIWSYREQNAATVTAAIVDRAREGTVAVTTDAGMPGISDPGRELVAAARAAGVAVEVLPGPCAFVCAAVLSGFPLTGLSFEGFVPRTNGERERVFRATFARGTAAAWYESPRRILATLAVLERIAPEAALFVARELTKLHEQQILGGPAAVAAALGTAPRGEIVLVIDGASPLSRAAPAAAETVDAAIRRAFAAGASVPDVARTLARQGLGSRADLYARASVLRDEAKVLP